MAAFGGLAAKKLPLVILVQKSSQEVNDSFTTGDRTVRPKSSKLGRLSREPTPSRRSFSSSSPPPPEAPQQAAANTSAAPVVEDAGTATAGGVGEVFRYQASAQELGAQGAE